MSDATPALVRLEWLVERLEPAVDLLCNRVGFEFLQHARHPVLDADVALLRTGHVGLLLVCPTSTGDGQPVLDPTPGMTQLVFGVDGSGGYDALREKLIESGAAVSDDGPDELHLARAMVEDVFGTSPVLTFLRAGGPERQQLDGDED